MPQLNWQKSSFSDGAGANCLELAISPADVTILLRESDAPGVILTTTRTRLADLLTRIKADEITLVL
ncbi:DUF397 domain-containing protein [Streptomyces sp. H39-S7]|uniref:DUF397 domain-containing protein n=1 Tax=Streptomyces sp. H39-S7 TaxID=3004357 RepID=UPI0022AEC45C|nr:DUF397 domain-containing protein [Streptomyces sp. H39-S7]MCZ4120749.1 DUF397 domain-containing protein [Streptomyces sp. H39-S7]